MEKSKSQPFLGSQPKSWDFRNGLNKNCSHFLLLQPFLNLVQNFLSLLQKPTVACQPGAVLIQLHHKTTMAKAKQYATKDDKAAKWNKTDDKKFLALVDSSNDNGINLSCSKHNVELIHRHWPHREWKNFALLIRKKLQELSVQQVLHGGRRSKSWMLVTILWFTTHSPPFHSSTSQRGRSCWSRLLHRRRIVQRRKRRGRHFPQIWRHWHRRRRSSRPRRRRCCQHAPQ